MQNPKVNIHGSCSNSVTHMRNCASSGRPVIVKAVDNAGLVLDACNIAAQFGVPATVIMRWVDLPGYPQGIPNYQEEPVAAGMKYAAAVKQRLSQAPELTPLTGKFYLSIFNEIRTQIDPDNPNYNNMHPVSWIAVCGQTVAEELLAAGHKVTLFSFNAGTPEPEDWLREKVPDLLRFAAANKDHVMIDCHEGYPIGAGLNDDWRQYWPHMIGRFVHMYTACQVLQIGFPSIVISEFAWQYDNMPDGTQALKVVQEVLAEVYQPWSGFNALYLWTGLFPGANSTLSNKMCSFANTTLWNYTLTGSVEVEPIPEPEPDCFGKPRVQYARTYVLLHDSMSVEWWLAAARGGYAPRGTPASGRFTVGTSADDAGVADLLKRRIIAVNPELWGAGEDGTGLEGFFKQYYPGATYIPLAAATPAELEDKLKVLDPNNPPQPVPIATMFSAPIGTAAERDAGELWND